MQTIRYLSTMMLMLLCAASAWGQNDEFNPENPSEPGAPPTKMIVLVEPSNGGTVSGGGRYVPETQVRMRAYSNTGFMFSKWTDTQGNVVSTSSSFYYTKGNCSDTLIAHFDYSPSSPAEPVPGTQLVYYKLTLAAGTGCSSVSGGGKYQCGTNVTLKAYAETGFSFANWTNEDGEIVSKSSSFTYTTNAFAEKLTANYIFNPSSPDEPSDPILSHDISLSCTDGGTVNFSTKRVKKGISTAITATCNTGYVFKGWYSADTLYTMLRSFSYTMGDKDVCYEARFEWNPSSPTEPSMPADKKYAMYLMSAITYPGKDVECPMYLTSLDTLQDMTFQLTFNDTIQPNWETLQLDEQLQGYCISVTETDSANVYLLSLIGGTVNPGNTRLFSMKVNVPDSVTPNSQHQVKINQVSVAGTSGLTTTASTRNGKVYVYKLGDTNGDGEVNITDRVNMINYIVTGKADDGSFIKEVSDVNDDGEYNITDSVGILDILLNE